MAKGHHSPLALQSAWPAWGPAGSMQREAGAAGQASTDTLMWGKAGWEGGMTLRKSKGAFVCLQGGIHEKEKPLSAGTRSGQAALFLGQDSCAGLGRAVSWMSDLDHLKNHRQSY